MPDWTTEIRARLSTVSLAPMREAEIIEELSQHLDDHWRELIAQGHAPDEATRLTRAAFTDDTLLAQRLTALKQGRWTDPTPPALNRPFSIQGLGADLRYAARALRASPSFTIAALIVLTLGIGATTAIFSIVDAVVLRGLPFDQADRLVAVGEVRGGPRPAPKAAAAPANASGPGRASAAAGAAPSAKGAPSVASTLAAFGGIDPDALASVQPQNYLDWVAQQQVFESIAAIANSEFTLSTQGREPEAVLAQRVTASFFDVLRVRPARGQAFTVDQETNGRHRVAVLSDGFWQRRFNADPNAIGTTVSIDGEPYDVIGVMPPGFSYPVGALKGAELWVPYVVPDSERIRGRGHSFYLQSIARLRPGVTFDQAGAEMLRLTAAIDAANPDWSRGASARVRPLQDHLIGASMRAWMLMLLAAVAIVLVIACANVAHLLLARVTTRQREVAVRAALGASRWRLVRQSMVESLLLSASGSILAIAMAWWAVMALRAAMPEGVPRVTTIALNWRVLLAASALALGTGLICGIIPALRASRPDLVGALSQGLRAGGAGRQRQRLRHALVVAELALALVLVVGAALFVGSFVRLMRIDPGFNPDRVLTFQIARRSEPGQPRPDYSQNLIQMTDRIRALPGVLSVSASWPAIPMRPQSWRTDFRVPGQEADLQRGTLVKVVTPDYFKTLGIALRQGRLFTIDDRSGPAGAAIINETAVRTYFGADSPLNRTVAIDGVDRTIVGVVADARQENFEAPADVEAYLPLSGQHAPAGFVSIRTSGEPYQALPSIRTAALAVLPNVPLRYVSTMDELIAGQTAQRRLTMLMLGLFGVLGLMIAAVGVYGAMAYLVAQRTREIGVRMALGATRKRVIGMIVARAAALVLIGIAVGSAGSWYLAGAVRSFLFGLEATDIRGFLIAALALSIAGLSACLVPAWRAATVDPTVALRNE